MPEAEVDWGRREDARRGSSVVAPLALLVGVGTGIAVFWSLRLVLVNAVGPLPDAIGVATLLTVLGAVLAGLLVGLVLLRVARRSRLLGVVLLVVLVVGGRVLFPDRVDVHESFVPQANQRWSCTGWEFSYYPPETMDASQDDYCVGIEHPLAPG